ncbi:MAG TPA: DUF1501 domain-containing protein [Phycisphaerae bacterium]|nr:DUF1501 domain-containing protein [Phycisphaerae bacterium]
MNLEESTGCREYQELSRRKFLTYTGAGVAALGVPAWLPSVVLADDYCSTRDVIVSIFLRGAADGLSLCVPHGEPAYYSARSTIAVPPPGGGANAATDLDGFFGLAPAMAPLTTAYSAGHLLIVHATGSTNESRSHFDAQRFMEIGKPGDNTLFTGWLGRHLVSAPPRQPGAVLRAVGIGYGLQRTLQGSPNSLPIPVLDAFGLTGSAATLDARMMALDDMYAAEADPLRAAAQTTQATIDLLNTIDFAGYQPAPGAVYGSDTFSISMKSTAALIKADVGVEAVHIDVGGWDTHNNQGTTGGTMANLMASLASNLAAFHLDMFAGNGRNVVVVVHSEFGRRLAQNGSGGSDHGHGNAILVLGNGIDGGRVLTQWPGLAADQLFEGRDLQVTIDFRDILAEIVANRLGNTNLSYVFPDYVPTFRGVTTDCAPGDVNCDGLADHADAAALAQALTDPAAHAAAHPTCNPNAADINRDGLTDARDIQEFVNAALP